ncbi:MAG: hypothetical protein PVI23_09285 [Maricaulaceae bacterium]|jgi:hypothetical protein
MRKRILLAAGFAALIGLGACETMMEPASASSSAALEARIAELEEENRVARLTLAEEQERNAAQTFLMRQEIARLQGQIATLREQCGDACAQ